MAFQIVLNKTGYVNPAISALDTGWTISTIYAIHVACNSGSIISLTPLGLIIGRQYTFTYTIDQYSSGGVKVICGASNGTNRTANGTYTQTLTCTTIAQVSFLSDGGLRLSKFKFYDTLLGPTAGVTISFNEGNNQWGTDYSYQPEILLKFIDQFLTIKNGGLWLHETNETRGNFYGVQYPAEIDIVINTVYQKDKLFYNLRLDAKGKWYAPILQTVGSNQFPNGMVSRLKKNNFKQIDGKLWAEILNDINDPNFATITDPNERALQALFNGRKMQGGWMLVTFRCDDTTRTEISSLETYYINVERSI